MASRAEIQAEITRRQGLPTQPGVQVLPDGQQQAIDTETQRRQDIETEIQRRQGLEQPAPAQPAPEQPSLLEKIDKQILDLPGGAAISEFASAVNRGTLNLADFFTTDVINSALAVVGSEKRVPTLAGTAADVGIGVGDFMEPGLAREAIRTGGEFIAPTGAIGQTLRTVAQAIPKVAAAIPTVGQRVVQAAAAPAGPELVAGAAAGAGTELGAPVGGAVGEAIAGEEGRVAGEQVGRLIGGVAGGITPSLIKQTVKSIATPSVKKLLTEAAPTVSGLKKAARVVYNELDNIGVTINPASVTKLSQSLKTLARKEGFSPRIQKKVNAGLKEFANVEGKEQTISEIDILRRIMNNASKSIEEPDKELGKVMVQRIDDFLDNLNQANFSKAFNKDVGAKYRDARQLWRRAKKTEQLEEVFQIAVDAKADFSSALSNQFRSILKSKKKSLGFTKEEIGAMRKVVQGGPIRNTAEQLGKLGFSSNNIVAQILGIGAGGAVTGGIGAVAVPITGELAKTLSVKLAKDSARNIQLLTRAGGSGKNVVKEYMKAVPPKQRSAEELTGLLLRPDISLANLKAATRGAVGKNAKLIDDAVFLTNAVKAMQTEQE